MARIQGGKISKRSVERLCVEERDTIFWDRDLPGFGVRVYPSGAKVYVVQTRGQGRSRRATLGRHGSLSPVDARRNAARFIARVKEWDEPQAAAESDVVTVAEFAERYLEEHVAVRCKPRTRVLYEAVFRRHLVPTLGETPVLEVSREQVADLHYGLRETPYSANRAVNLLAQLLDAAQERGLRPSNAVNPCRSIEKFGERRHERFLSDEEFRRLGRVLEAAAGGAGGASPAAVAAIRLLALTGCRRSEILGLRWDEVDLEAGELRLRDSKTGARTVPLSPAAAEVIAELPTIPGNPWVIPGRNAGAPLRNLQYPWEILRARAGLDDVRIHDLRHSFASRALSLGEGLPIIGELLGHRRAGTTARYTHLALESVKASAGRVATSIEADIHQRSPTPGGGG
ncbi:MAG: tyrosine-type recombinase/integrase [Immundisolibacterales bacterium]|nr:tyrosine-type recombinase/integrase [Immundisolibacterales bacterium]